jgi:hypothetical protein
MKSIKNQYTLHRRKSFLIEQKIQCHQVKTRKIDSIIIRQDSNIKRKYLFATNFALNNRKFEVAPFIALSEIYDINIKYLDTIQNQCLPSSQFIIWKKLTQYIASIKSQNRKHCLNFSYLKQKIILISQDDFFCFKTQAILKAQ